MGTGFICIVNNNGSATNWSTYGNIFYWTGNYLDGLINTGVIMNRYDNSPSPSAINVAAVNWHIYNNIIANIRGGSFTAAIAPEGPLSSYVVENNIWYNNVAGAGADGSLVDYNWYYANGDNGNSGSHDVVGTSNPFQDAQPWLTGNWQLKAPIPGVSLSAPYDVDPNGVTRGADGTWDRGAYEYVPVLSVASTAATGASDSSSTASLGVSSSSSNSVATTTGTASKSSTSYASSLSSTTSPSLSTSSASSVSSVSASSTTTTSADLINDGPLTQLCKLLIVVILSLVFF